MANTSVYGLPYQAMTDPPHGPNLGQDLAEAVETELARIDAAVEASTARVVGKRYAANNNNLATGIGSTAALTNIDTGLVTLTPGHGYRCHARFGYLASSASVNWWAFTVRRGSVGGASYGDYVLKTDQAAFSLTDGWDFIFPDIGAAPITDTWYLVCARISGTDTLTINKFTTNAAFLYLEDVGSRTRLTESAL